MSRASPVYLHPREWLSASHIAGSLQRDDRNPLPRKRPQRPTALRALPRATLLYRTPMSDPATWPNLPERVKSRFLPVNGLRMHILEARPEDNSTHAPLVLLLHGFPELAYCWRKILGPLADAGCHVVAPDQRGYGRTTNESGKNVEYADSLEPFRMTNLVKDVIGLVYALGYDSVAAVVGHDFGSPVAAYCALIRPDLFKSVVLMSAPFTGAPRIRPEPLLVGASLDPTWQMISVALAQLDPPKKHYMVYHSTPEAAQDLSNPPNGLQSSLRAYYHVKSGDWKGNSEPRPHPLEAEGLGPSQEAPDWLTDAELAVYIEEFKRTGYQGALNWYRIKTGAGGEDDLALFSGKRIEIPAMFISGSLDWGTYQSPGATEIMRRRTCSKMDDEDFVLIEGVGHWVQQEKSAEVVKELLRFLGKVA
ncbi:Epoxide hydrolase hydrolase [Mycena chlorophos]|uniref:Epoxide hydrolase hydrolase n=1 Tax=Mycena chlorophos TaxID=658473 RepID=A0A8H6TLY8_MYCCL|nr:Epoxide hydrolase hydrolase [Mycena chlorophos]